MMRVLNFLRQLAIYFSYGLLCILSVITLFFSFATVIRFRQHEQNDLFDIVRDHVPLLLLSMAVILVLMRIVLKCMTRSMTMGESRSRSESKIRSRSEQGKSGEHPPFPWPMLLAAGGMSLFLVLVIRGNATNDALQLDEIMQAFSRGDYSSLQEGGYLFVYPFQVTYVLIGQVLQALCGPSNYLVYQLLNVVSILCNLYFLYQITWELFHDRRVCAVMQLLSMGCWFYYVFATFIYADLWSFAVQSAAFLLEIRYLNRRRLRDIIGAGICIAAATLLKTNCYVALIAMILILLMDAVNAAVSVAAGTAASGNAGASGNVAGTAAAENAGASGNTAGTAAAENAGAYGNTAGTGATGKSAGALILRAVLFGVMFVVLTKGAQSAVNLGTARAAGIEKMPEGVPSAAYFAMGMEETEGKYGWYNGRNVGLFRDAGYDREQTVLDARETMKASIGEFQNSKRYFIRFYAGKFLSQWGDPTCVSMREMEETRRHTGELPKLVDFLIFGTGSRILQGVMNVTHSLIYLGLTIYLLSATGSALRRKQKLRMLTQNGQQAQNGQQVQKQAQHLHTVSEPEILLVLFLVGGMLFHQIWEASGRYTMRYYLTMLPLAAWGICRLIGGKQQEA